MGVAGEALDQSFEKRFANARDFFDAVSLSEEYDGPALTEAFLNLAGVVLSGEGEMTSIERLTLLRDSAKYVYEFAGNRGDSEVAENFSGRADGYDDALQLLEAAESPAEQLRAGIRPVSAFIARLGLVHREVAAAPTSGTFFPPDGSIIRVVPLEGAALPSSKLQDQALVPLDPGEALPVSYFMFDFPGTRLRVRAAHRPQWHILDREDHVIDLGELGVPFEVVKTEGAEEV